jgi:hypothetical protein
VLVTLAKYQWMPTKTLPAQGQAQLVPLAQPVQLDQLVQLMQPVPLAQPAQAAQAAGAAGAQVERHV